MLDFLASDAGLVVSWVLLCLGMADLVIGWWWFGRGRRPKEVDEELPQLRRWLPAIFLFDALLVTVGLVGLRLHGVV